MTAALGPEPGWSPVEPFTLLGARRSFVSTDRADDRLRVAYFRRSSDDALVGKVWFGPGTEGPPGRVHGGSIAAVLDEAMGAAAWMRNWPVVAGQLSIAFNRFIPLGNVVAFEAWIDQLAPRTMQIKARLLAEGGEDQPYAEASGTFVRISLDRIRAEPDARLEST